jgi:hypothetical protein
MSEPTGAIRIVESQNWLRYKGTHKNKGICCALVLVWIQEILQGRGQWEATARPDDAQRWTPNAHPGGTKLGTFLGGHVASRIFLEIKEAEGFQGYPRAIAAAYDKRGMDMQTGQGFDLEPDDALDDIAKSQGPRSFHLDMWDHAVGIHFCGPGAATYYFDPNYGVYRYGSIDAFKTGVKSHLLARRYCDMDSRDQRRREIAGSPVALK